MPRAMSAPLPPRNVEKRSVPLTVSIAETNASVDPPPKEVSIAFEVVGKVVLFVLPVTYAIPGVSTAMP
jgi:hypothetical protein